jgi:hypothetical protein
MAFFGCLATGVVALAILAVCLDEGGNWYAFSVPAVGIVLFLGFAMLGHYLHEEYSEAAMKHGLAAGFVGVYFTALGLSLVKTKAGTTLAFDPSLLKYLTVAVGAIVTAYFGAAAVTAKKSQGKNQS